MHMHNDKWIVGSVQYRVSAHEINKIFEEMDLGDQYRAFAPSADSRLPLDGRIEIFGREGGWWDFFGLSVYVNTNEYHNKSSLFVKADILSRMENHHRVVRQMRKEGRKKFSDATKSDDYDGLYFEVLERAINNI
jgi:hypothetical protein